MESEQQQQEEEYYEEYYNPSNELLIQGALEGKTELIKEAISQGSDVNYTHQQQGNCSALHLAAREGHEEGLLQNCFLFECPQFSVSF